MAIFTGIDHLALAVRDVDKMTRWYCDMLGYDKHAGRPGGAWLLRAPDGGFLEVMPQDETPRPNRTNFTPGWSHLALRVRKLDEAIRVLDMKGVTWSGEIAEAVGGGRLRNLVDPEGNCWQLVERENAR
jgi:glyoxylase I family protein